MDVVLDTNIVISAAISPNGPPGAIIKAWRAGSFTWITSPDLLDELARAFAYPRVRKYLAWESAQVSEFLDLVRHTAVLVEPEERIHAVERDADDNRVLEAAVTCRVQYLVTNDDALLDLKAYGEIEIVTAARFAAILASL